MYFDKKRQCVVNDNGTLIKPVANGCRGHSSGIGNKYKCSSLACVPLYCDHTPVWGNSRTCAEMPRTDDRFYGNHADGLCEQAQKRIARWHAYLQKELAV